MKKTTTTIHEKIAVRAYYAWLSGSTAGADADWLAAEQIELAYAERRAVAAGKAAETRKAKAPAKTSIRAAIVPAIKRRAGILTATAH